MSERPSSDDEPAAFAPPVPPSPPDPIVGRATPPPGAPPPAPAAPAWPPERGNLSTPGTATMSVVLGILGLVFCPVICSVAAIALGVSARRQIDTNPRYSGRGVAQTGIYLGILGLIVFVVFLLIGVAGFLGVGGLDSDVLRDL